MTDDATATPNAQPGGQRRTIIIVAVCLIILFVVGLLPRIFRSLELMREHQTLTRQIRTSRAVIIKAGPAVTPLLLPGDTQAVQQIPIMARADGYLARRYVDIGDQVRKGQLLATLSTPELDQQLRQAQADLRTAQANYASAIATYKHYLAAQHAADALVQQSKANLAYSDVENKRYELLAYQGAVSWEVRDSYLTQLKANAATLKNAQENASAADLQTRASLQQMNAAREAVDSSLANERRLSALQGYKNVYAPYDGVITARYVDNGSLIASGGGGTQLLAMGNLDILRIFVQVPQTVYRRFHVGDTANVIVPEFPNRVFAGIVTNISGGLDPQSRTLQIEVRVDNRQHLLPAGVYAEVRFNLPATIKTCIVPINAVSSRPQGNLVAVMRGGKAYFQAIDIYRDFGATIETTRALHPGDVVLLDPPDDLRNGEPVHAVLMAGGPEEQEEQ